MAIKNPRSHNTGKRDINDVSAGVDYLTRQVNNSFIAHQDTLDDLSTSRLMPVDTYHYAHWPCDDPSGSTILRQAVAGGPGDLVCSATALPGAFGYVQEKCVRLSTDAATSQATVTPTTPTMSTVTMAAWIRLGTPTITPRNLFCWRDSISGDNTGFSLRGAVADPHIVNFFVTVGGVLFTLTISADGHLDSGSWHHVGMSYDGETLIGYIDGNNVASNATPSGAVSWSTGIGTKAWRLGTSSSNGQAGYYCDIRVISGVMAPVWFAEAYRRGYRCLF